MPVSMRKGRQVVVVGTMAVRVNACRVTVFLILAAVAAIVLPAGNAAYAAESGDGVQNGIAAGSVLKLQEDAIIPAPVNKPTMYQVYAKYFDFDPGPAYKSGCVLRLEYRAKGGKWKTSGWMGFSDDYKISGLRPNTVYYVRLYYEPNANGEILYNYHSNSAYSNTIKIKTGPNKKPAIKSVSVKAINVKQKKQHVFGYVIYWGSLTFYRYKVRTTVTFKKAPKTPYVWINGKVFKGNKKKYVVTSAWRDTYSRPSKNKWSVAVYTFRDKKWGGYSKLYSKKKKIS